MRKARPTRSFPRLSICLAAAFCAAGVPALKAQTEDFFGWEAGLEGIDAGDISTSSATVAIRRDRQSGQWRVQAAVDRFAMDYEPNALSAGIGREASLQENRTSFDVSFSRSLSPRWEGSLSANVAEGFSDYRAVWIHEYYRQLFSGFSAFDSPDPGSWGGSAGVRWEAVPENVFVDFTFGFTQERIAPGYERIIGPGGGLEKDEELLNAWSGTVAVEHLLSPRHRLRHEVTAITISGRDPRFSYRGQLRWAVRHNWAVRTDGSYLREGDDFHAWSLGVGAERDWKERWFAGLTVRYYEDNGQLEDSLFTVTSAAPPLETLRLTGSLRYVAESFSILLYGGPYVSDYGSAGEDIAPFVNLYSDRDWLHGGLRISFSF